MSGLIFKIALIGFSGIASQWAAWRLRIPAIALLLVSGILLGPVSGILDPQESFGDLYRPMIALAVAIILFEGGLTLNFKEITETSTAVRRIILIGGPLVWLMSSLAAHYAAGLSWPTAIVLGAILVVTGPTVIMPLLRQAQLSPRPASLLRWEAIVNDPIGALFAVIAFEIYLVLHGAHDGATLVGLLIFGAAVAVGGGYLAGRTLAYCFVRGYVPEFLKAPIMLITVLAVYAISDVILEESGLLTVTVMGITIANSRIASLTEMRRFKETITVLLVSGLFIMLTASLDLTALQSLGWGALAFVVLILFVVRPIAIFVATTGSGLTFSEKALVSWIAPRGIVAVAVSGLFGASLTELGVVDGSKLTALTFTVVASTILLHGFTLSPMASLLGLKSAEKPGLLLIGGSQWTEALATKIKEMGLPVLIVDANWSHIRSARLADIPVHYGEVLSEDAHHHIVLNRYSHLIAATDNDPYNALVCTEFGPELGRGNVFQIGTHREENERQAVSFTIGGRSIFKPGRDYSELRKQMWMGWTFQCTTLSEEFNYEAYLASRGEDTAVLLWAGGNGSIVFGEGNHGQLPTAGDTILAFGPPLETGDAATNAINRNNN